MTDLTRTDEESTDDLDGREPGVKRTDEVCRPVQQWSAGADLRQWWSRAAPITAPNAPIHPSLSLSTG